MKIRNGFISNSSSSSFIVRVPDENIPFESIADLYGINKDLPEVDRYYLSCMIGLVIKYGEEMDECLKESNLEYYDWRVRAGNEEDVKKFSDYSENLQSKDKHVYIDEADDGYSKRMRVRIKDAKKDEGSIYEYGEGLYHTFDLRDIDCQPEEFFNNPKMIIYTLE